MGKGREVEFTNGPAPSASSYIGFGLEATSPKPDLNPMSYDPSPYPVFLGYGPFDMARILLHAKKLIYIYIYIYIFYHIVFVFLSIQINKNTQK
jgi:hypothetical protein